MHTTRSKSSEKDEDKTTNLYHMSFIADEPTKNPASAGSILRYVSNLEMGIPVLKESPAGEETPKIQMPENSRSRLRGGINSYSRMELSLDGILNASSSARHVSVDGSPSPFLGRQGFSYNEKSSGSEATRSRREVQAAKIKKDLFHRATQDIAPQKPSKRGSISCTTSGSVCTSASIPLSASSSNTSSPVSTALPSGLDFSVTAGLSKARLPVPLPDQPPKIAKRVESMEGITDKPPKIAKWVGSMTETSKDRPPKLARRVGSMDRDGPPKLAKRRKSRASNTVMSTEQDLDNDCTSPSTKQNFVWT